MKLLKYILTSLVLVVSAFAQTTTTTGTITFPGGQAFANGTVRAIFTPPTGITDQNLYKINGVNFTYEVSGVMDATGHFSIVLTNDHLVSPQGGRWNFVVCSLATLPCVQSLQDVFGASIDLSGLINADVANATNALVGSPETLPKFYTDAQALQDPNGGSLYFNLVSHAVRLYNGSSWSNIGGGGTGTVTSFSIDCTGVPSGFLNCSTATATTTPAVTVTSPFSFRGNTTIIGLVKGAFTTGHCLVPDVDGNITDAGFACTSGGTPANPLTSVQFNLGGAFTGDSFFKYDSTTLKNLTIASINRRRKSEAFVWTSNPTDDLSVAGAGKTLTYTSCPRGTNVQNLTRIPYSVYISGVGTPEAAVVTGGTCTPAGGSAGTLIVTTQNAHAAGYTVSTAYDGIQEALNDACGVSSVAAFRNGPCAVDIAPTPPPSAGTITGHDVYASIVFQANDSALIGHGAIINCRPGTYLLRGPCLIVGELEGDSDNYTRNVVYDINFRPPTSMVSDPAYNGVLLQDQQRIAGVITIHTASAHGFKTGDRVTQMFTDGKYFWGDIPAVTVVDATTYTYTRSGGVADVPFHTGPGVAALQYVAVADNSGGTKYHNVKIGHAFLSGAFNNFFDAYDNEDMEIDGFETTGGINHNTNWAGSAVFAGGENNQANNALNHAPVITLRNSNMTNVIGVTDYTGNGLFVENSIIQAQPLWQVYNSNDAGNFQGAAIRNLYGEPALSLATSTSTPFGDLGVVGMIAGKSTGAAFYSVSGFQNPAGLFPVRGSGTTIYGYCVIARDTTTSTNTGCLPVMSRLENAAGTQQVKWPRMAGTEPGDTILYDVLRFTMPSSTFAGATVFPYTGGCGGGSVSACGSVVVGQAQGAGFVQTFTDDTSVATTNYATVPTGNWTGPILFWPSTSMVTHGSAMNTQIGGFVTGVALSGAGLGIGQVGLVSPACITNSTVVNGTSACLTGGTANNNATANPKATILLEGPASGGGMQNTKGRLNFGQTSATVSAKRDTITLTDSNFNKTKASGFLNRPTADAADGAIGVDTTDGIASTVGIGFRAPTSLSNYINNIFDGTSWLEQLTAAAKTFKVPITTNSQFTTTLATGTPPFVVTSTTPVPNLTLSNHPKVQACGATSTCSATAQTSGQIVQGSAPLVSGTPSTVTITGISPAFTNTSSYNCTVSDQTTGSALFYTKVSGSSITITGPNTVTDVISYICAGN